MSLFKIKLNIYFPFSNDCNRRNHQIFMTIYSKSSDVWPYFLRLPKIVDEELQTLCIFYNVLVQAFSCVCNVHIRIKGIIKCFTSVCVELMESQTFEEKFYLKFMCACKCGQLTYLWFGRVGGGWLSICSTKNIFNNILSVHFSPSGA